MKAEIYTSLASLNSAFDTAVECLNGLQQHGVITADFVNEQSIAIQELWAKINAVIVDKMNTREAEDQEHFAKMRENIGKPISDL